MWGGPTTAMWGGPTTAMWGRPTTGMWGGPTTALWGGPTTVMWGGPTTVMWGGPTTAMWGGPTTAMWGGPTTVMWGGPTTAMWGRPTTVMWGGPTTAMWGGPFRAADSPRDDRDTPRPISSRHFFRHLLGREVDDRHVVRRSVRRVSGLAIGKDRDAPRPLTDGHRSGRVVGFRIHEEQAAERSGRHVDDRSVGMHRDAHRPRLRRVALSLEGDQPHELVLLAVDDGNRAVVLARAVGQKSNRARAMTDRNLLENLVRHGVDRVDRAFVLAGHVDDFAVGPNRHALGLFAHLHRRDDVP